MRGVRIDFRIAFDFLSRFGCAMPLWVMRNAISAVESMPTSSKEVVETDDRSPEVELILRAQTGDRWAQEALFRRWIGPVLGFSRRLCSSQELAEDIAQDALALAFRKLPKLRSPEAFRTWLFRIVANRARRVGKREALLRNLGLSGGASLPLEQATSELGPEQRAMLMEASAHLHRLPTELRIAWTLRHIEQETLPDCASIAGCSLATIKRRVSEADRQLQKRLGGAS